MTLAGLTFNLYPCFAGGMARPLRIERAGGRCHVTARGNERKPIFRDDIDRYHFLELLSDLDERFGARIHAYVLMDNHFHLLVETPEANLSRAMQWLGVSYSIWFNRRHDRAGHLFQGRFQAQIIEDDAGWQEVARYVHLNPVRIARLGLNKRQRAASRAGLVSRPGDAILAERLTILREFRWSSYRGYAGYCAALNWVCLDPLARLCGGRTDQERRAALRQYTEQAIRQGAIERPWDRLIAGIVLDSEAFAQRLRRQARANPREQRQFNASPNPSPGRISLWLWKRPGASRGMTFALATATGAATPRCGWAAAGAVCAWPNWAGWPAAWTTPPSARRSVVSAAASSANRPCAAP